MKLLFVHGWGFDSRVWDKTRAHLSGFEHDCVDFGFTKDMPVHEELPGTPYIAVGHSMGVMWALKNRNSHMKGLVSIGGFDCFFRHVPPEVLTGFRQRFETDPESHMKRFWAQGLEEDLCSIDRLNLDRLSEGMNWLATWDAEKDAHDFSGPILAIALKNDKIVPPAMSRAVWEKIPNAKLVWHETGSHFLPSTEPEYCAEKIRGFAGDLGA